MSGPKDSARDQNWLVNALTVANLPTLCCLLVHLTGDRSWIEGEFVPSRTRGLDDNDSGGFTEGVKQKIRGAAYAAVTDWLSGKGPALPNPTDELLVEMMSTSLGEVVPQSYAPMIRRDLALSENSVPSPISTPANSDFCALIIGAGISGLCAAIEFEGAGIPYTIVERHIDLGGVWFENRYPGAACDVPSYLYSFSFAAYDWSRFFAGSGEIHNYLGSGCIKLVACKGEV